jgi:hypothetical protein
MIRIGEFFASSKYSKARAQLRRGSVALWCHSRKRMGRKGYWFPNQKRACELVTNEKSSCCAISRARSDR